MYPSSSGMWRGYTYAIGTYEECSIVYNTQTKVLRINYVDPNNMLRYAEFSPTEDGERTQILQNNEHHFYLYSYLIIALLIIILSTHNLIPLNFSDFSYTK